MPVRRLLLPALLASAPLAASAAPQPSAPAPTIAASKIKGPIPPGATRKEIEMGDEAAQEIERSPRIKLLDPKSSPAAQALLDKLNEMARELGARSGRPEIAYEVKVIEDPDLNAFTLPNGKIYFYRGLLEFASSDDEIAAVMSHEIGHNALMHSIRHQAKAKKMSWVGLAALAAMLAGRDGANIGQFSQYLLTGIMNGYSENYEKEADTAAIEQMKGTRWNPSALVTFMSRLEQVEKARPEWEAGIFRTHPPSEARADAAMIKLKSEGLPFSPRDVQGARRAQAIALADRVRVQFGPEVLLELAATPETMPVALARGESIATRLNDLLKDNLKLHEITLRSTANDATVVARGVTLVRVQAADGALHKTTPMAVAQKARDSFRQLFWREAIRGAF